MKQSDAEKIEGEQAGLLGTFAKQVCYDNVRRSKSIHFTKVDLTTKTLRLAKKLTTRSTAN